MFNISSKNIEKFIRKSRKYRLRKALSCSIIGTIKSLVSFDHSPQLFVLRFIRLQANFEATSILPTGGIYGGLKSMSELLMRRNSDE